MNETKEFVVNKNNKLIAYTGSCKILQIPEGIKIIGYDFLIWNENKNRIQKIILPEGLEEIEDNAFKGLNITEINLPSTLKKIGMGAFSNCLCLEKLIIPSGITHIPDAMAMMSGINEIIIPESTISIGEMAFYDCHELKTITIPDSVTHIGKYAFYQCTRLSKVNINHIESITIDFHAFADCPAFKNKENLCIVQNRIMSYQPVVGNNHVTIPNSINEIESDVFNRVKIHLEMTIHCPTWECEFHTEPYDHVSSLLHVTGSTITFVDESFKRIAYIVLAFKGETKNIADGAKLSIRCIDHKFDFAHYDNYFNSLVEPRNKIPIALARFEYPYEVSDEMLITYQNYLKNHMDTLGQMLIDENKLNTLIKLGDKQLFTLNSITNLIDYAQSKNNFDITALLLNYKNMLFGEVKPDYSLGILKKDSE